MVRTEHDIVSQVRSAKTDPEAADALIRQYMGFIRSETVKFLHTAPENGHEDELSIAMLAFYEAGILGVFLALTIGLVGGFLHSEFGVHTGVQFMTYYASSWIVTQLLSLAAIIA